MYKQLIWSNNLTSNPYHCNYAHCIAETPFGQIIISWKDWKEFPIYDVWTSPWEETDYCNITGSNLETFKKDVQSWYEAKLSKILAKLKEASFAKEGWMCKVDFNHELGEASGGTSIYESKEELIEKRVCVTNCGIQKVSVFPG